MPDREKPSRVVPELVKERLKVDPDTIVMEWEVPSAWNVAGEGDPPFIVTTALGAELLKVTVIGWVTVTVKMAFAEWLLRSLAWMFFIPDPVDAGTVNEHRNEPEVSVVTVAGLVVMLAPGKVNVIVDRPEKPLPVTETRVPTGPVVGLRLSDVATLNVAVAAFPNESVTWTVLTPKGDGGILNVTPEGKAPLAVEIDVATVAPS
jgi:hypothetical protein